MPLTKINAVSIIACYGQPIQLQNALDYGFSQMSTLEGQTLVDYCMEVGDT